MAILNLIYYFLCILVIFLNVSGGYGKEDPPVPIPNTEVKLFSADGTAWASVWESRTLPELFLKAP